ncbi:PadR family transcriptional regulator [Micromonospora sp. KLBMP9576]|uniref:PadR family transcriptional regulator n=1 Tax=Micromonospora sp. KLBMP9576 TaxID=3424769 RepID=UPI003D94D7F6
MIAADPGASADGDRQTQLLRGALDMCLLALLATRATHGYELVRRLEAVGFEGVGYGTIYPLLTRMRRLGLVADELQASPTGPQRKVYALTTNGEERLRAWRCQWMRFVNTVDTALAEADTSTDSARS